MSTADAIKKQSVFSTQTNKELKIGIVVSEWNFDITDNLYKGAFETLLKNEVLEKNIFTCYVPGSFELVYGAKKLIQEKKLHAVIVIGSVIKGETEHFHYVCQAVSSGIKDLNVKYDVPVIFSVLTDDNKQQAIDRSGGKYGNKGEEAAISALKMVSLKF